MRLKIFFIFLDRNNVIRSYKKKKNILALINKMRERDRRLWEVEKQDLVWELVSCDCEEEMKNIKNVPNLDLYGSYGIKKFWINKKPMAKLNQGKGFKGIIFKDCYM